MDKKEQEEHRCVPSTNDYNNTNAGPVRRNGNTTYKNNKDNKKHVDFKYDRVGIFEMQPEENWVPVYNQTRGSETDLTERIVSLPSQYAQLEAEVREIRRLLKHMVDKNLESTKKDYLAREWKLVALVLDRLFFFIYLLAIIISALTLFETALLQTGAEYQVKPSNQT